MAEEAWRRFIDLEPTGDVGEGAGEEVPDGVAGVVPKNGNARHQGKEDQPTNNGVLEVLNGGGSPVVHSSNDTPKLSVLDRVKQIVADVRASKPAQALQYLDKKTGQLLRNVQENVVPFNDEIPAAGQALAEMAKRAVGLSDDKRSFGDVYRAERTKERKANEEARADPVLRTAGQAASLAVPGATAAKVANRGARAAVGLTESVAYGLGASDAELTGDKKETLQAIKDAGLAAAFGLIPVAAESIRTGSKAIRARNEQITQDIGAGADQAVQRRAMPNEEAAETIVDLIDRRPELRKKISGDRDELKAEAGKIIDELSAKTGPTYRQFDEAGGLVPARDILQRIDNEIATLSKQTDTEQLRKALQEARDDIVNVTRARAGDDKGPAFGGKKNWTHQDVRDWVTGLLRSKQSASPDSVKFAYKNELHKLADDFLRSRMDEVAAKAPQLRAPLEDLRQTNRDLSAAIRIEDVASNADNRAFQKRGDLGKNIGRVVGATAGGAGAMVGGAGAGVMGAVGGLLAGGMVPPIANAVARQQTDLAGRVARAAAEGKPGAKQLERILRGGVPQRIYRNVLAPDSTDPAPAPEPTESDGTEAWRRFIDLDDSPASGEPTTPGNIDLFAQPEVKNEDGSISTVDSFSTNVDGKEVLLPTVTPDGRHLSEADALKEFEKTGRHLGIFDTPAAASAYAEQLHKDYEAGKYKRKRP
jgi:hypothetical protein